MRDFRPFAGEYGTGDGVVVGGIPGRGFRFPCARVPDRMDAPDEEPLRTRKAGIRLRICHLDMASGASGDMFVAALLDAGFPFDQLMKTLGPLDLPGVRVGTERVYRNAILVTRFLVEAPEERQERHLEEILGLIERLPVPARQKRRTAAAFRLLAEAEAHLHGVPLDEVHFHEVGAADSIVDFVAIMAGLEYFSVDAVTSSPIPMPHGVIRCRHGLIPNPAPATMRLLHGFPHRAVDIAEEMVTPTAAAVIAALAPERPVELFRPERSGNGAGGRIVAGTPGFLRVTIGETACGGTGRPEKTEKKRSRKP